jgi:hypothetical protein
MVSEFITHILLDVTVTVHGSMSYVLFLTICYCWFTVSCRVIHFIVTLYFTFFMLISVLFSSFVIFTLEKFMSIQNSTLFVGGVMNVYLQENINYILVTAMCHHLYLFVVSMIL